MSEMLVMAAEEPWVSRHVHGEQPARRQHVVNLPDDTRIVVEVLDDVERDHQVGRGRRAERIPLHIRHTVGTRRVQSPQQFDGSRIDVEPGDGSLRRRLPEARDGAAAAHADHERTGRRVHVPREHPRDDVLLRAEPPAFVVCVSQERAALLRRRQRHRRPV